MKIIVAGLNHKSAPIDIRERLAFDAADTTKALKQLKNKFPDTEFVLLSTCNRVELYSAGSSSAGARDVDGEKIANFLSEFHGLAPEEFREFLYVYRDSDAVRHLLMVASSLDSMVVGESQIIAQVKESYSLACRTKSTGKILNRLFHCGFETSKKVHTITSISNGRVSVAGVGVELAKQLFADVSSARTVVIGAGEMGELLVQHLLHVGCKDIVVVNRSYEHALDIAAHYGIKGRKWEELHEQLIAADIVIASAAVQDYLFEKNLFRKITDKRRMGTLLIIDIAVPRNFEPAINELEDVYLYSIDDLSNVVEQNRKAREKDITEGMRIVDKSVSDFMDWFRARDIGPLIGQMRQKFVQIGQKELDSFFAGLGQEAPCREAAESMVKRIVNRLLHCVIKNVNLVTQKHGPAEAAKLIDSIIRQAEEISSEPDSDEETSS
ncbi:MAG: glutamyl-tRNA reductase [Planctomycetota bacterium]|jgi:glutamyl-tRNA reductase